MAIDAGTLEIKMMMGIARLQGDVTQAKEIVGSGMRAISQSVAQAKSVIATLGVGLSVGALVAFAKSIIDATARFKDLGQEAGTTASEISKFEAPARMAGLGLDSVAAAMFRLSKAALEAKDPASKAAQAFSAIGISTAQLKGMKPDEMFELIARQSAKYGKGLEMNAVMQELVNKSGKEMNKVFAEIASTGKLTATVTDEQAEAADRLQDQMVELKMNSEKFWRSQAGPGVDAMNDMLKAFIAGLKYGNLYVAMVDAMSVAFDKALGKTPQMQLALVNQELELHKKSVQDMDALWAKLGMKINPEGQRAQAAAMNEILARRQGIEHAIWEAEFAAQTKRATEGKSNKPKPEFDPAAAANAAAAKKASDDLIGSLEKELAAVNNLSGENKKLTDVMGQIDRLKRDGKPVDEAKILNLATEIDLANRLIKANEFLAAQNQANNDAAAARGTAQEELSNSWAEATDQLQMELELVGQSNEGRQRALLLEKARLDIVAAGKNAAVVRDINAALALQLGLIGKISAAQKLADLPAEMAAAWRKAGDDIGASLTKAFGAGGSAAGAMFKAFADGIATQIELDDQYAKAKEEVGADLATLEKKHQQDTTQNSLKSYGDMAGAAASFFDKQSTAYKVLSGIEKAMYLVKFAMQAQAMVMDLTATGASVANSGARASADGVAAFAKTLSSLPYPYNLVAGATVLAALAAVGVAIAGGGGGGGTHVAGSVAAQANQGTGTVLGDSTAKSESIVNALEDVRDNSNEDLLYTSAMLASLREIEASMSGLAQLAARIGLTGQNVELPGGGGGNTFSLDDAGLIIGRMIGAANSEHTQFTGQSVGSLITNPGASQYTDIARTHSGTFGSSYTAVNRDFASLTEEFSAQISNATTGIRDTLAIAINILTGETHSIQDIEDALNSINIDPHTISFAGLHGDEIQSAIEAVFGAIGDDMASGIMGLNLFSDDNLNTLSTFQHVGEGAFETIVRVASGVERAQAVLGQWGIAIMDWRDIVNTQGDVTAELIRGSLVAAQTVDGVTSSIGLLIHGFDGSADDVISLYKKLLQLGVLLRASAIDTAHLSQVMITAAGGLSALQSGLEAYASGFFTIEEQSAAARAELVTSFGRLGLDLPATREAFRALVEAAQAAGDETLLGQLLALAPAFAHLVPAITAVADATDDAAARMAAAAAGLSVGEVGAAAMTAAQAWLERIKGVFSGEDYATNQGHIQAAIIQQVSDATAHLLAVQASHLDAQGNQTPLDWQGRPYADIVAAIAQLNEYKAQLAALGVDMARYYVLEAANPGHGKELMDLEDWYNQQKVLVGGNQAALLALEEIYQKKRQDLLEGSIGEMESAMGGLRSYIDGLLLNQQLTTLSPTQQFDEARRQYESTLALAQGGDAGAIGRLSGSSDTYLKIAREIYASSGAYNAIFRDVVTALGGVAGLAPADVNARLANALPTGSTLASSADMKENSDLLRELIMLIASGLSTTDPAVRQAIEDLAAKIKSGGLLAA